MCEVPSELIRDAIIQCKQAYILAIVEGLDFEVLVLYVFRNPCGAFK